MLHLHRIPHSVDVRRGGLHPVVHQDAALDPQLQPGRLGEAGVRRDADGQHHHVGGEGRLVLQQHIDPVTVGGKALHSAAQMQPHPFLPQLGVEEGGHVRVQGIQQLAGPLDHGDVDAQLPQVFHFLSFQEFIDATQVFFHTLITELVYLGNQSVKEVTVVRNNNQCSIKIHQSLFQNIFCLHVKMVSRLVQNKQVNRLQQ